MSWKSLLQQAYVPYSQQPNSCVVESRQGKFFAGLRIENISYPLTISAVQAGCAICLSEGEIPGKIYVRNSSADQLSFWEKECDLEVIVTDTPPLEKISSLLKTKPADFNISDSLKSLLPKAVTPNSDFPVSALLHVEDGYFEGVNVEVSEWSMGICAERVAIAKAMASGYGKYLKLDIHTLKGEVSSPCGACRQVISELLPYHPVHLHHADGTLSEHLSVDLLPFSFKSSALRK